LFLADQRKLPILGPFLPQIVTSNPVLVDHCSESDNLLLVSKQGAKLADFLGLEKKGKKLAS